MFLLNALALMSFNAAATSLLGGTLSLSALKYEPYPAQPGQYTVLWVNVLNSAATSSNVECMIDPAFPFSLDTNDSATRYIGQLLAGQSVVLKYKLRVDAKAVFGDNEISFKCRSKPGDWNSIKFSITVQPTDVVVSITKVETTPFEISPGQEATVRVFVKNQASSTVRDVSLKLDLSSLTLPFAFVKSAGEQRLQYLDPGEEKALNFEIMSASDAVAKLYKTTLNLSYSDQAGKSYSRSDSIGLLINAKPELTADLESADILRPGQNGKIVIKIANKGLSDAKFLTATLNDSDGFQVLSSNNVYIGGLVSDDYQTIEYKLYTSPSASKNIILPLKLAFKDANNKQYYEKREVTLRLYSEEEITRLDLEKKAGLNLVVIAITALILLYAAWRIYKWYSHRKKRT